MTTLWVLHPTALPWLSQLEEDKKLWFLWGQRPASRLTYTTAQTKKSKRTLIKTKSLTALLYPEVLLCFRLTAEQGCAAQPQGAGLLLPICKRDWWGEEGRGARRCPLETTASESTSVSMTNQHHKFQNTNT